MGARRDKGRALTRYLTGSTGIPFLAWDGIHGAIDAPSPYKIDVTTSRSLGNWHDLIRGINSASQHMVIRYDYNMDSVADAWVAMKLGGFVPLLTAHYQTISDRVEGE
jgi:hypothetical protein